MKILQVSHGLPPREQAGVEIYTLSLSRALSRLGHAVCLFCREGDALQEDFSLIEDEMEGLHVTRVIHHMKNLSTLRAYYDLHDFDEPFLQVLKREGPDLIHFQHLFGLSANLLRVAKEEGIPVVFSLHDFFFLCHRIHLLKEDLELCGGPRYGLECASCIGGSLHPQDFRSKILFKMKDRLPFPVLKWMKRFFLPARYLNDAGYEVFHRYQYFQEVLKYPDLLLAPSRFVQTLFLKYYPFLRTKMRVLGLGIPPLGTGRDPIRPIKKVDGKVRFCYFGNILPLKGLHVLVEAFRGLPAGKVGLTIYGRKDPWNEEYYDHLVRKAQGLPVEFKGVFQRESLGELMKDQDVMVLPSLAPESYSFVLREAFLLNLPVIASRIGALPEGVEEGVDGLLFRPGDPVDLRRCMLRMVEEPRPAKRMASGAKKVKSMEEHARELSGLYQQIAENR